MLASPLIITRMRVKAILVSRLAFRLTTPPWTSLLASAAASSLIHWRLPLSWGRAAPGGWGRAGRAAPWCLGPAPGPAWPPAPATGTPALTSASARRSARSNGSNPRWGGSRQTQPSSLIGETFDRRREGISWNSINGFPNARLIHN